MKNIHVLPTDKPSRLFDFMTKLMLVDKISSDEGNMNRHIYITSEEIKEGDKDFYIIANDRDKTWINCLEKVVECKIDPKHGKVLILFSETFLWVDEGKKIILTTDPDLINDGVQAIPNEFLEWLVKNPSCEWVELGFMSNITSNGSIRHYKIIIPKEDYIGVHLRHCYQGEYEDCCKYGEDDCPTKTLEEPKQELHICKYCGVETTQPDDERYAKHKQETLEAAAAKHFNKEIFVEGVTIQYALQEAFIIGAKWQQERSQQIIPFDAYNIEVFTIKPDENGKLFAYIGYKITNGNFHFNVVPFTEPKQDKNKYSEEEVLELLRKAHFVEQNIDEWFEQFKK